MKPKAQSYHNKGMASEEDDQCFWMAQSEHKSKAYQTPVEWLEEACAQQIPSQFVRPEALLWEMME